MSDSAPERNLPQRAARDDLRRRAADLPSNHPSAADYDPQRGRGLETRPDGARADQSDRLRPAAERPEWQEPIARGEVERVGLGIVDERQ